VKYVEKKLNKEIKMKKLLVLFAMLFTITAHAAFPDKPVKIITSLPIGSGPDNISRKLAEKLSAKWGVPVIVENKPGGNGAVSFAAYNDAPADGYTILSGDAGNFVGYPILYNKPEVLADIEPLTGQNMTNMMLVVSPKIKDFADLKNKLRSNPTFASGGVGSPMHLEGLELADYFKQKTDHIPYKDYGIMWVDTANGIVTYTFAAIGSTQSLEKSGKLKYLAYAGATRHPDYPNVPTVNELTGQNKQFIRAWVVFYIKKNAPANAKAKLVSDISEVMKTNEMQDMIKGLGYQSPPFTSNGLQKFVDGEATEFNKLVKKYNVTVQ
jgi:tripartite-type tricarboxylate transporter receptor subunit TctC